MYFSRNNKRSIPGITVAPNLTGPLLPAILPTKLVYFSNIFPVCISSQYYILVFKFGIQFTFIFFQDERVYISLWEYFLIYVLFPQEVRLVWHLNRQLIFRNSQASRCWTCLDTKLETQHKTYSFKPLTLCSTNYNMTCTAILFTPSIHTYSLFSL